MKILNTHSCLECEDDIQLENHHIECSNILNKILDVDDYDCALICKYQDICNQNKKQIIMNCMLSEIQDKFQYFDIKNGLDMFLDDDNYIVFLLYGKEYLYDGIYNLTTIAIKVLPYNKERLFLDISNIVLKKEQRAIISNNQFDKQNLF